MSKSYGQYCGLTRALDVIGDRWNLLIVRQLLVGAARYRDLLNGLPGVATNLLADRLRDLEAAGVVERRLAEERNAVRYALTPWGAELRETVNALVRWSAPLMMRGPEGDRFRVEWLAIALPALLESRGSAAAPATVGVTVDGETVQVRATGTGIEAERHDGRALDAVLHGDAPTVLALAAGGFTLDEALARPEIEIDGDERAVRAVFGAAGSAAGTAAPSAAASAARSTPP